jgi:hypothetical protein
MSAHSSSPLVKDAPTRAEHELVSFAVFLDYRARRMHRPVSGLQVTTPEPTHPPAPDGDGVAIQVPVTSDE